MYLSTGLQRVITVGELLIDFTSLDENKTVKDTSTFEKNAGGAPANVAVAVARLGGQAQFVGCVGKDPLGAFLRDAIASYGVDTSYVFTVPEDTTLAFVARHDGEPDYYFFRSPGSDTLLSIEHIANVHLDQHSIVHFGSNSLAVDPIKSAVHAFVKRAKAQQAIVSFDVNLREAFWANVEDALVAAQDMARQADILKVNTSELHWLTGEHDVDQALTAISSMTDAVVLCTLGASGAAVVKKGEQPLYVSGFPAKVVDATGAGDTFAGALLYQLSRDGVLRADLALLSGETWTTYVRFATAAAAINVTQKGAMAAMPSLSQVQSLL